MITKWQDLLKQISVDTGLPESECRATIERYHADVREKLENIDKAIVYTPLGCFHTFKRRLQERITANEVILGRYVENGPHLGKEESFKSNVAQMEDRIGRFKIILETTNGVKNGGITRIREETRRLREDKKANGPVKKGRPKKTGNAKDI